MNLTNHFLIATPSMNDPRFKHALLYVCEHNEEGAMGIMVNTPVNINVGKMLKQLEIDPVHPQICLKSLSNPVFHSGPVADDRGFILHTPKDTYQSSIQISDTLVLTTSKDILEVLGTEAEPKDYLIALGYAGWEANQLETEIAESAWLTVEADLETIFHTPASKRWKSALKNLGVDEVQLSSQSGHA